MGSFDVSSGHGTGGGLKHRGDLDLPAVAHGFLRSRDRRRVETAIPVGGELVGEGVSSGHGTGGGLKLALAITRVLDIVVSSGHGTGGGLKLEADVVVLGVRAVSSGHGTGGGLKHGDSLRGRGCLRGFPPVTGPEAG